MHRNNLSGRQKRRNIHHYRKLKSQVKKNERSARIGKVARLDLQSSSEQLCKQVIADAFRPSTRYDHTLTPTDVVHDRHTHQVTLELKLKVTKTTEPITEDALIHLLRFPDDIVDHFLQRT